jgi:hypothetical protein
LASNLKDFDENVETMTSRVAAYICKKEHENESNAVHTDSLLGLGRYGITSPFKKATVLYCDFDGKKLM